MTYLALNLWNITNLSISLGLLALGYTWGVTDGDG